MRRPPSSPFFPSTPLFGPPAEDRDRDEIDGRGVAGNSGDHGGARADDERHGEHRQCEKCAVPPLLSGEEREREDRKSTRLDSSHANISYAVFCLKKKNTDH